MRVIYYLQNNIRAIHIVAITFLTLTSCGTYQQASYDDDGIYGSNEERRQTTEVATVNKNGAYQNYFEQKSLEADDRYGDVFTDVDSYSSQENLDSETDTEAIGYSESYSPWGDVADNVVVNIYSSSVGFGGWGFGGWGFNNGWGYNRWGNNWGLGFGGAFWSPYPPYPGFWSPGFYNPYFGYGGFYGYGHPYFNRYRYGSPYVAYNRGRRGNYYRNPDLAGRSSNTAYSRRGNSNYSRRYNASRSSRRANNVRATRSNTRTIRSTQNTRTRNNTRVTRNTRQVRSNTRSTTRGTSRNNSVRSNTRSTRSPSIRSSSRGGRSSSSGKSSRGRGGRG